VQATVGSALGVASYADIFREPFNALISRLDVPDPDIQVCQFEHPVYFQCLWCCHRDSRVIACVHPVPTMNAEES